jgi:hypothetical protein
MSTSPVSNSESLAEHDPAQARRLSGVLLGTLRNELGRSADEARELASTVVWTVTRERDGDWLNLTYESGPVIGGGGDLGDDEDGLTVYIRQLAYHLVGREGDFQP